MCENTFDMAQLHLYLPEDLAEKVRRRAASRRQSVSAYLAELVRGQIADAWPEGYFENVVGGWGRRAATKARIFGRRDSRGVRCIYSTPTLASGF